MQNPISEADSNRSEAFYMFAKQFREQSNYDQIKNWITFFEEEYDCAGICKPALFSWTRSIHEGRPTESCISSLKDDVTSNLFYLGLVGLVSGILLFCIFLSQYCLWKKYDD